MLFESLAHEKIVALDTEGQGLEDRHKPVGLGYKTGSGKQGYLAWGHGSANNCSVSEVERWVYNEITCRPDITVVMHNAPFDWGMLCKVGIVLPLDQIEDTGILAPLIDERMESFSLEHLSSVYTGQHKLDDTELNEWCAAKFGGKADTKTQIKNYWRAPANMVAPYCLQDCHLTLDLYRTLVPLLDVTDQEGRDLNSVYRNIERPLFPVLMRMNRVGTRVDVARTHETQDALDAEFDEWKSRWDADFPGVNHNSTPQIIELLMKLGIKESQFGHTKPSSRFPQGQLSCTKETLAALDHPVARMIRTMRNIEKYSGTFLESYILKNVGDDGLVHGNFHQLKKESNGGWGPSTGTVSGRLSSSGGLNLQNIPAPDPDKPDSTKHKMAVKIRSLFVPMDKGQQILSADLSQIEFRLCAHYAGGSLEKAYRDNPDIDFHDLVAAITKIHRKPAKTINFGLAYGMGVPLMAERLNLSEDEARQMLEEYHRRLPEVRQIYRRTMNRASERGYIVTWGGRRRRFHEDPQRRFGQYAHTHKALNALLQGGGADLIKMIMVDVDRMIDYKESPLHMSIHDELVMSVPLGSEGDRIIRMVKDCMESYSSRFRVPIRADCEVGPNWGETVKWRPSAWASTE